MDIDPALVFRTTEGLVGQLEGYGASARLDSLVFVAMVKYDPDRPPHTVIQVQYDAPQPPEYLAAVLRAAAETIETRVDPDDLPSLD